MDPLPDVLRVVRLNGAYFYAVEASAPWGIEAVAATELTPRILSDADHLISYHILTEGTCLGSVKGGEPVGRAKVAAMASEVGYESGPVQPRLEKATGLSPGSWREARGSG